MASGIRESSRRDRRGEWGVLLVAIAALAAPAEGRYPSRPSPLSDERIVILRPDRFVLPDGKVATLVSDPGAVFGGRAAAVPSPIQTQLDVRFHGDYTLWIRVGGVDGVQRAVKADLVGGSQVRLSRILNDGLGSLEQGGPKAYEAYVRQAIRNAPSGAAVAEAGVAAEYDLKALGAQSQNRDEVEGEGFAAFVEDVQKSSGEKWVSVHRVDPRAKAGFFWWRVGTVRLDPGRYELRIGPATPAGHGLPLVDAAFLTTYGKLTYPFAGDINAPRASYVRFRIDAVPESGVIISASIVTHGRPNSTPVVYLNPSGMDEKTGEPHTTPGLTAWYSLQDIERAPGLDFGEVHLHIQLATPRKDVTLRGATQLAMFPYADHIVREFDWNEPDGRLINMAMDFERWRSYLKTYRDCARDYYDMALARADGQLHPLTRPGLFFGSGAGATPDMLDYVTKTLRLLGYNVVGSGNGSIEYQNRFGWGFAAGVPRMEWYMPFTDDADSLRKYEAEYAFLKGQADFYRGCPIWQMADEPGEGLRHEMTSPLWRYESQGIPEPRWVDYPGYAGLFTRKTDYQDCVLDGKIARFATIRILVAVDDPAKPGRYGYWRLGKVLPHELSQENLMAGRSWTDEERVVRLDPKATFGSTLVPFKIVYEGDRAALFLGGNPIQEIAGLPTKGGFGFDEGAKAVADLRIRPIRRGERLTRPDVKTDTGLETGTQAPAEGEDEVIDKLEEPGTKGTPDWARPKPLKEFVEQDWVVTGGFPEAHQGFRRWAAAQGLTPELFGRKTWEEVSPLTIRNLVQDSNDARLFYWSRQYSAYLTPKMFSLAAEAIRRNSPNPSIQAYIGLSGGYLNVFDCTVLDMFQLAAYPNGLMPGISDWHWYSAESDQVNAYSAAIFNAGARRYGQAPASISMMHVVHPSLLRAYACLANGVKYLSYYSFGPYVLGVAGDTWSHIPGCYEACSSVDNRAAQIDDLLRPAVLRPSRVALLWSQATDHWDQARSFVDKRCTFLGLSHEYYQPDLVTEAQVRSGALTHYDALYVLDPYVVGEVQSRIAEWVRAGGLLWTCADALTRNEYNETEDLLQRLCGLVRVFSEAGKTAGNTPAPPVLVPVDGDTAFRPHAVTADGIPERFDAGSARVRARYRDGRPAWLEWPVGRGRVAYVAHRAGATYASRIVTWYPRIWPDTGRTTLVQPLREASIERDLILSEPLVLAAAQGTDDGTVIVLFNMQPTPRRNLSVSLKEPARPYRVEAFDRLVLKPLPHVFENGRVQMTLPDLEGGQMIVVRRRPPPPDDRLDGERRRAEALLASSNPLDLAAGAWMAGLRPEWGLAAKVRALLQHPRWEVRRSAAEALGCLKDVTAGDEIAHALEKETDAHARGDQVVALSRLGHSKASAFSLALLADTRIFVKQQAVQAMLNLVPEGPGAAPAAGEASGTPPARPEDDLRLLAEQVAEAALQEPDVRVRGLGIKLLFRLNPIRGLEGAIKAFAETPDDESLPCWSTETAKRDAAFAAYIERGMPGGPRFLLALAGERPHEKLAAALLQRVPNIPAENARAWIRALICQKDKTLTRGVFANRDKLGGVAASLAAILEHVFEARLGSSLADWQEWLAAEFP